MPSGRSRHPQWVLVVATGERDLHELLRRRLEGTGVEVVLDRRARDRRRGSAGPSVERRVEERRRATWLAVVAEAALGAPRDVPAPAGATVGPAGPGYPLCPQCGVALEVELPRFPHPPARIEVHVTHVESKSRSDHYVEIAAFTLSGRRLLSQRAPARRRT